MTGIIRNKTRPSRALCGAPLWGAPNDPANVRNYPMGQHGIRGRGKKSDYGLQLLEKQKLRRYYNIKEKQFKNTFNKAANKSGNTVRNFVQALESRLDSIIYRAGFASTVFQARQLVSHGHITINGKKVKVRSCAVKPGDVVAVRSSSKAFAQILENVAECKRAVPEYIQVDTKKLEATYLRKPEEVEEVPYAVIMNMHLIVELYSR